MESFTSTSRTRYMIHECYGHLSSVNASLLASVLTTLTSSYLTKLIVGYLSLLLGTILVSRSLHLTPNPWTLLDLGEQLTSSKRAMIALLTIYQILLLLCGIVLILSLTVF